MTGATRTVGRFHWSRLVGDLDRPPERSVGVRVLVLATLALAVAAAATTGATTTTTAVVAILVMLAGGAVADWRREDTTPWIAAAVTLLIVGIVARFMLTRTAVASPAELRTPLAELLITMECARTVAMRTRRELRFAVSSSAAIVAVAASMSLSMGFAIPLVAWTVCAGLALAASHRSDLMERLNEQRGTQVRRRRPNAAPTAAALGVAVVIAAGVFLVVPAAQSSRFLSSISRLPNQVPVPQPGGLSNPTLGSGNPAGGGDSTGPAESFGYFGFTNRLDTGVRGRPDNTLVMRVRASAPDFWRGQSFDTWNGREWSISDERTRVLRGNGVIPVSAVPGDPPVRSGELIQTFFLETGGPNVIFGAPRPSQVYIPQSSLFQLPDGTLRTGVELDAGTIYTVVSRRPEATAGLLRAAGDTAASSPEEIVRRFGVEDNVPPRVAELARRLTSGLATTYDKVRALERWMGDNTAYSLDIPPLPPGADAVEQYLFVDRTGFCEQIATSLVVMLRSQGIPARLAVGYTPGERNPFTSLFEVRASDAHAWAEVYFPTVGWQAFDPTAEVPLAGDHRPDAARVGLGEYLARHLGPYRTPLTGLVIALLAAAAGAIAWRPVRRHLARRAARRAATWSQRTLARLEAIGAPLGRPRRPEETMSEYASALRRGVLPDPRLEPIAAAMDADAFAPAGIDSGEREAVDALLAAIADGAEISR